MLTFTHAAGELDRSIRRGLSREEAFWATVGSIGPDAYYWILGAYLVAKGEFSWQKLDFGGATNHQLDLWLHSVIPPGVLLMLFHGNPRAQALAIAWLRHNVIDIGWHRTDARPFLYPLWGKRFRVLSNSEGRLRWVVLAVEAGICARAARSWIQRRSRNQS